MEKLTIFYGQISMATLNYQRVIIIFTKRFLHVWRVHLKNLVVLQIFTYRTCDGYLDISVTWYHIWYLDVPRGLPRNQYIYIWIFTYMIIPLFRWFLWRFSHSAPPRYRSQDMYPASGSRNAAHTSPPGVKPIAVRWLVFFSFYPWM